MSDSMKFSESVENFTIENRLTTGETKALLRMCELLRNGDFRLISALFSEFRTNSDDYKRLLEMVLLKQTLLWMTYETFSSMQESH